MALMRPQSGKVADLVACERREYAWQRELHAVAAVDMERGNERHIERVHSSPENEFSNDFEDIRDSE